MDEKELVNRLEVSIAYYQQQEFFWQSRDGNEAEEWKSDRLEMETKLKELKEKDGN